METVSAGVGVGVRAGQSALASAHSLEIDVAARIKTVRPPALALYVLEGRRASACP